MGLPQDGAGPWDYFRQQPPRDVHPDEARGSGHQYLLARHRLVLSCAMNAGGAHRVYQHIAKTAKNLYCPPA